MSKQLFGNNASSLLAASISDSDLSIQVATGEGAKYPSPGGGDYFLVTLENADGDIEVVKITSRTTDLLTVPVSGRGQEGTSAQSWTNGQARVELRLTKGTMEVFLQRGGDAMTGDLDMDGNDIIDAHLVGTGTKILAGEIVAVPLRGATGDSSNEIAVPNDGTRATAGGAELLTEDDDLSGSSNIFKPGMLMMWYGASADCPDGWHICDGTNGTPDLRNRFPVGVGTDYALNASGGAATSSGSTGAGGAHNHGGDSGNTTLTTAQIPAHAHHTFRDTIVGSDVWSDNDDAIAGESSAGGDTEYDLSPTDTGTWKGESESIGGGGAHKHSIASQAAHTHTVGLSTLPPYRAVHFIMKLA